MLPTLMTLLGHSKMMVLPAGARNVKISFQSSENVSLTLKVDRNCGSEK